MCRLIPLEVRRMDSDNSYKQTFRLLCFTPSLIDPLSSGALTPFGDLHNYLPPPPPFVSDILKGLEHAKKPYSSTINDIAMSIKSVTNQDAPVALEGSIDLSSALTLEGPPEGSAADSTIAQLPAAEDAIMPEQEGLQAREDLQCFPRSSMDACSSRPTQEATSVIPPDITVEDHQEEVDINSQDVEDQEVGDGHFDEDEGVYRLVSRRQYKKEEEVFLCYGRHTNLELLEHYGFVLENNPHGAPKPHKPVSHVTSIHFPPSITPCKGSHYEIRNVCIHVQG